MPNVAETHKNFLLNVLSSIGGSLVTSVVAILWQHIRNQSVDWWAIVGLFLLTCVVFFFVIRLLRGDAGNGVPGIQTANSERYFFLDSRTVRTPDGMTLEFKQGRMYEPPERTIADLVRDGIAVPEHEGRKIFDFLDGRRRELIQQLGESQQRLIAQQEESERELKQIAAANLKKDQDCAAWQRGFEKLQSGNAELKKQLQEHEERLRTQSAQDPRIYINIEERRSGPFSKSITTAFIVSNRGGSEARNVQLSFPTLSHLVTVAQLDVIQPDQNVQTFPELLQERWPDDKHNIYAAFESTSFKSQEDSAEGTMHFDMTISYENYNRTRRFVVPVTVAYRLTEAALKRNGLQLRHDRPAVEVTHGDTRVTVV